LKVEVISKILAALPKLEISKFPAGSIVPRMPKVKPLISYNGFDGFERMRTWEVVKWLMAGGVMPTPKICDLCLGEADQYHAENYFDFSAYVPVCRSCHGKVHNRLRFPSAWERNKASFAKPNEHWVNLLRNQDLPIADFCRSMGTVEPTFSDFIQPSGYLAPTK
jgi:hypothetical protein